MKKIDIHRTDLIIGSLVVFLVIVSSLGTFIPFEWLEKAIYGAEMRFSLPQGIGENKIAIVNIDEKSIESIGPWPWPRHLIAEMISILKNNGARLIALDLAFNDYEQNQGLDEIRKLHDTIIKRGELDQTGSWIISILNDVEKKLDNDKRLSEAVKESNNVILPVFGHLGKYETELLLNDDSYISRNSLKSSDFNINKGKFIPANKLITPFPELAESCNGLGHLNLYPNEFKKGQTHLLFFNYRGHVIPSMPLRIALDYLGKIHGEALKKGKGLWPTESEVTADGEVLIKYRGSRKSFPYYSFVDILKVKKVPAVFEDKIVLIGYTGEGSPMVNTPVDPQMPRVEFTANIVEDLLQGRYLKRPPGTVYIEVLLIFLFGLITTLALPRLDFLNRLAFLLGLLFFTFLIGVISFVFFDTWLKTAYIALGVFFIYISMLVRDIIVGQRSIDRTSKEAMEMNRMLGLSFQNQGLLDLAFEKFRKCALDDSMKDVVYNLGLDYERKRMINKAIAVYEYINRNDSKYRDLGDRILKLRKAIGALPVGDRSKTKKEEKILVADDLEIKPTVGRYEILEELGQGAMGIVYKARDPKINRLLAIKTIRFSDEFEEEKVKEVKERFLKEAEIAGQLSHPVIVSIYDVGEDYELTYLAMEFLEGEDLRAFTRKQTLLPLKKVLFIVHEVASGLNYAHSAGVIHRDIKPANIMILKNGKVKVTDFGIAKAVSSSQTKSGVVLGTPNYMSPEQINGQNIDGRSDIFSLGIVFFELLTGQLPFQGKNLTNLLYQITHARHPSVKDINPKIPRPCEQIIDKALNKDPRQRFQSGGDLAKYIRVILDRIEQIRPN